MKNISLLRSLYLLPVLLLVAISCTDEKAGTSAGQTDVSKLVKKGAVIYEEKCLKCHGENGQGGICPNLIDGKWKYGGTDEDIYTSIAGGRPGGMPNWDKELGDEKIKSIVAYIKNLNTK